MKNSILLYFSFLFVGLCYAQTGTAIYIKEMPMSKVKQQKLEVMRKNDPQMFRQIQEIQTKRKTIIEMLEYELIFSPEKASFEAIDLLEVAEENYLELALGTSRGYYYTNRLSNENLWQTNRLGQNFIIDIGNTTWEITGEKKMMGEFLVQQAIGTRTFMEDNKEKKIQVEAWFCDNIPASFGPIGYGGLPGLIIDLTTSSEHYHLKRLNLESELSKIDRPKNGKEITYQEFRSLIKEALGKMKPY